MRWAVIAASGSLVMLGWTWWLFLAPGPTDRGALSAGPLRRMLRWYRNVWLRTGFALAAWPHVVDLVMGVRRVPTGSSPRQEVWRDGPARLYRYASARTTSEPVLLIHAFVTRPWILDLTERRSLVRALVERGHDVYLLDWGDAARSDAGRGLDDYATTLLSAEQEILASSRAERLHLVGYCSGATLAFARLAAWPHEWVSSFVSVAGPIDLAVPGGMQLMMSHRMLKPALLLDGSSCLPAATIRESFHALRPAALRSVARGRSLRRDRDAWQSYGALARWVWDQRRIPGALFFDMVDLFRSNSLYEGTLSIAGRPAVPSSVRAPVLLAIAERDHIVPAGSSHAAGSIEGLDVEVLSCPSGHVSMLTGRGAVEVLYPGVLEWLGRRSDEKGSGAARLRRRRASGSLSAR